MSVAEPRGAAVADGGGESLAEVLRASGRTDVKIPCGEGTCGGCTVLLGGRPVVSCLVPAGRVATGDVRSARDLTPEGTAERIADELARCGALQCGFCIPGVVASTTALLSERPDPDRTDIEQALQGHLCRCTGYAGLVEAVQRAVADVETPRPPHRVDGVAKATGEQLFLADTAVLEGALVGRLVTATRPHARVRVLVGTAMEVPGAVRVLGPDDSPPRGFHANPHDGGRGPREHAVFAAEARFVGEIVGLVVATSTAAAEQMRKRVVVEQIDLPATCGLDDGRLADACIMGAPAAAVDAALAAADRVFDDVYDYDGGPVAAMERIAAVARWDGDVCHLRSTSQLPALVPALIGELLEVDAGCIRVEPMTLGGSFGIKEEVVLEPVSAVASLLCGGRSVLVEATREEMSSLRRRHRARVRVVTGCDSTGEVVARRVVCDLDAGAYVGHSSPIMHAAGGLALQVYPGGTVRYEGSVVLSNTTPSTAFRGYGAGEVLFAIECQIEDIARHYAVDPLVMRRRHVARPDAPANAVLSNPRSFSAVACLDAAADHEWDESGPVDAAGRWRRGRGAALVAIVSSGAGGGSTDSAQAMCLLLPDGQIVVRTGAVEMGQGAHTVLAAVAAARLGVAADAVRVEVAEAHERPHDPGTFASRGVYLSANAVDEAAGRLALLRAELAGEPTDTVLEASATVTTEDSGLSAGVQLVQVRVDTWTGRVIVERVVTLHDVGRVMNHELAVGQVLGGVAQGIGIALSERLQHDADLRPVEVSLLHQELVRAGSLPVVEVHFVTGELVPGGLHAKGLGEAPVVGIPAAVANAVRDATGVRVRQLPLTPERIWSALSQLP